MKNESGLPQRVSAGLIVTHADLAEALRRAVLRVTGVDDHLETLSNEGLTQSELGERIRSRVEALGNRACVVFVDFRGGSCATACFDSLKDLPQVRVVSGVNLPMLVDFVLRRKDYDLDRLMERLLARGRNGVQLLKGS